MFRLSDSADVVDMVMGEPPEKGATRSEVVDQRQGDGWKLLLSVSADRLTASVKLIPSSAGAGCTPDDVVAFVGDSALRLSPSDATSLPERARALLARPAGEAVIVAEGRAAETWKDIDWLIPIGISSLRDYSDETVDLHDVSHFINVRAGQPLCEWPRDPAPGRDVLGDLIEPKPCPYELGERVEFDAKKPSRVVASEPGCVRFSNGRLSVEQHLDIPGDLDFKVGNIDFYGDVTIHGSVLDGFHVRSAKSVVIQGSVGASQIEAAGNLVIKGGVNGAHKGRLQCGGDLQAHYLHMVTVECGGDVLVDVECHDSNVLASGSVTVSRGGIVGGQVSAGANVSGGFLGAEMCVPTIVHAGHQPALDTRVERARKALAHARALVSNLESALSRLVEQPGVSARFPSQRKTQVIQLQTRLVDARMAEKRAKTELRGYLDGNALAGASIASTKPIYPKVRLIIDSACEEEVMTEIAGPVRLVVDREALAIKAASRSGSTEP
jgi:uncharacterized protein (DUF342 family)